MPSDLAEIFKFIRCISIGFISDCTSNIDGENLLSKNAFARQDDRRARLALGLGPHNMFFLTESTEVDSGLLLEMISKTLIVQQFCIINSPLKLIFFKIK